MNFTKSTYRRLAPLFYCTVMAGGLSGASISNTYTGALTAESGTAGSIVVESLTLTAASSVTIFTTSYGGGTNLNGTTTAAGGFQPDVTLFNTAGFAVATENGMFSPINHSLDGYILDPSVAAGTYYVILTDQANQVSASFTGFGNTAVSNFYTFFTGPGGTTFTDVDGNVRTANYALNISATPLAPTTVPEPATLALMIPAITGAVLFLRRRKVLLS